MDIPDAERFASEVRAIAEQRAQNGWQKESASDTAAFLLTPYPRREGTLHAGKGVLDLRASSECILGKLFFLNHDASTGYWIPFPTEETGSLADWLEANNLAEFTLVLVYRTSLAMTIRRRGIRDQSAETETIRDKKPTATFSELKDALAFFHKKHLLTPSGGIEVWEPRRAAEYVPGPHPEKAVQRALIMSLGSWFRGVVAVEPEDPTNIGRIDVRLLVSRNNCGLSYWAIIELKIIKSKVNAKRGVRPSLVGPAENAAVVIEGLNQARAYAANRQADAGLLEIFDLRKDKLQTLFDRSDVKTVWQQCVPPVIVSVRAVYGSASDARAAGFSG